MQHTTHVQRFRTNASGNRLIGWCEVTYGPITLRDVPIFRDEATEELTVGQPTARNSAGDKFFPTGSIDNAIHDDIIQYVTKAIARKEAQA